MTEGVASFLVSINPTRKEVMPRNPGDNRPGTGPGTGDGRGGDDSNRHDAGSSSNRDNTPGQQGTDAEPKRHPSDS